jgi:hypothetical protein
MKFDYLVIYFSFHLGQFEWGQFSVTRSKCLPQLHYAHLGVKSRPQFRYNPFFSTPRIAVDQKGYHICWSCTKTDTPYVGTHKVSPGPLHRCAGSRRRLTSWLSVQSPWQLTAADLPWCGALPSHIPNVSACQLKLHFCSTVRPGQQTDSVHPSCSLSLWILYSVHRSDISNIGTYKLSFCN